MCLECWREEGSPSGDSEGIREAASAVRCLYDVAPSGGAFHIVADDWNLETESLEWCFAHWHEYGLKEPAAAIEIYAGLSLLVLSEADRASALALHDGFWAP